MHAAPFRAVTRPLSAVLVALLIAACGTTETTSPPPAESVAAPSATAAATSEPQASEPPSPTPSSAGPFDPERVALDLELVTDGLVAPLALAHAGDGSGRLFVLEQRGQVRIVRDGELIGTPFLNVGDRITSGGERGLLGIAFHPAYPDDPRFFVNYTDLEGDTVVSSFEVAGDPDRADADSETVLLRIDQPFANHNGGALAFGPDGFLYISTGDGGAGGDPLDSGQRLDTLLGKILRIDVDGASGDRRYGIPDDNPFAGDGAVEPEIWHFGLRNPWRMSFDRATGDLWIGDVGQNEWEEVDVARAGESGLNFGWNRVEGPDCFEPPQCDESEFVPPVTHYGHDLGCSVVGGIVYRGTAQPILTGGYIYADYCGGTMWVLDAAGEGETGGERVLDADRDISAIGEDEAGEPYVTDHGDGELLRIVAQER